MGGRVPPPPPPPSSAAPRRATRSADEDAIAAVLASPGRPLDQASRHVMEQRLQNDLGHVRLHTDAAAAHAARALNARAFTVGEHVAFASGRFAPDTPSGTRLLAHELAHVLTPAPAASDGSRMVHRQVETADATDTPEERGPSRPEVEELDYAFVFTGGAYGRAAEAFIRRFHPTHRLIRAASFEQMFDRLYTDLRRVRGGRQAHVRELIVVTHANAAGGMQIPLTRGDTARRRRVFTIWDVDDLQEEFQAGMHRRFRERRREVVAQAIDDDTTVVVRGCEFGQADEALDVLRAMFGGQPTVWAPTGYQGYETIPIGSDLLRTPEDAFDFLMEQDYLPPDLQPAPDEDKRAYIARVFGLRGSIPAEFFVMGPAARERLGTMIRERRGISREAEALKVREPVSIPSGGEFWEWSSPGLLGSDVEFDRLTMREIADRGQALMTPYRPENACDIARLRRAWERKETSDPYWMDFLMSATTDPLAGLPGETASFLAYMTNRFRDNPAANPFNGLPIQNLFGDSNLIAIDAARYPCTTPQEDVFETQMLEHELPTATDRARTGEFEEGPAVAPPRTEPTPQRQPLGGAGGREAGVEGGGGRTRTTSDALAAHARALDFSKTGAPPPPPLSDQLARLSDRDLIEAFGLALQIAASGDTEPLEAVHDEMLRRELIGPTGGVQVTSMTEAEFETATGIAADSIPSGTALTGGPGVGVLFVPETNWYYRVLAPSDPTAAAIRGGADLLPRAPDPGFTFEPAGSRAEMTFRHLRPGGNVPRVGTDRISTARALDAFETLLRERGTGEMVRVDVPAARRLGAEFLEHPEIMSDLDAMERAFQAELEQAQRAGRGRRFIERIETRLRALRAARDYAVAFQEGQGVARIPAGAVTPVEGATLAEGVAAERALVRNVRYFRWGGRILLVVGAALSVHRVATATPEERPRVVAQEAGGWALSFGGAWAGVKAGGALGAALGIESGPGLLITGGIGALAGGVIGFFVGEEVGDWLYDLF